MSSHLLDTTLADMVRAGAQAVDSWAKENNFTVLAATFALREMYENLRSDTSAKIILVDRTRNKANLPLRHRVLAR
jgi:hypothetical protein